MRSFVAIDFSSELKNEIVKLQSELRDIASGGRWKYIDNFHLTLKFLGEVERPKVQEINKVLQEICTKTERFKLQIGNLGFFPGKGNIRVLWLKLDGELDKLRKLQAEIDSSLEKVGFESERRPYVPHVTIGQDIVFNMDFEEIRKLAIDKKYSSISVESVCLFKSEQVMNKRIYTPVSECKLI